MEVLQRRREFLQQYGDRAEALSFVAAEGQVPPTGLELFAEVDRIGLDADDTLYEVDPAYVCINAIHFCRWFVAERKTRGTNRPNPIHPRDYLRVIPDLNADNVHPGLIHYEQEALEALATIASKEDLLSAIVTFAYTLYDDRERAQGVCNILGIDNQTFWTTYSNFWRAITPTVAEGNRITPLSLTPGTIDFLELMYRNGKQIDVITNGSAVRIAGTLSSLFERVGHSDPGYSIVSATDPEVGGNKKPAPDVVVYAANRAGLQPKERLRGKLPYIYGGNQLNDLLAGANAGCALVFLLNTRGLVIPQEGWPPHLQVRNLGVLARRLVEEGILR